MKNLRDVEENLFLPGSAKRLNSCRQVTKQGISLSWMRPLKYMLCIKIDQSTHWLGVSSSEKESEAYELYIVLINSVSSEDSPL